MNFIYSLHKILIVAWRFCVLCVCLLFEFFNSTDLIAFSLAILLHAWTESFEDAI